MRFALAAILTLAIGLPAQADETFAQAQSVFLPLTPAAITQDIEGEWLSLALLGGATPTSHADPELIPSLLERFCGDDPVRGHQVAVEDEARFTIDAPGADPLVFTFDWLGGTRFSRSFDARALFDQLGFSSLDDERRLEMGSAALANMAREVDIYRIDPDLLVIAAPQGTEILGRCP